VTKLEMIRTLGDAIVAADELASRFAPGTPRREECDAQRDRLDRDHRRLSRRMLDERALSFRSRTERLEQLGCELRVAIADTSSDAKALQTLADLVAVVRELAELA
jgi:hypothetical protein